MRRLRVVRNQTASGEASATAASTRVDLPKENRATVRPVGSHSRREFSRKTKRLAWERCGGRCEGVLPPPSNSFQTFDIILYCSAPLRSGQFEYDHHDPDWFSNDNELSNCVVLCRTCHRSKTAKDQGDIAKTKRIRDKAIGALTSKNPMPFGRKSPWKKKLNGDVVQR
jgi:5-methylcytosine-specific restriction enzyme A